MITAAAVVSMFISASVAETTVGGMYLARGQPFIASRDTRVVECFFLLNTDNRSSRVVSRDHD